MPNRSVSNTASQESWLQISKVAIKLQCRCMLLNSIWNGSWWQFEEESSSGGLSWSSGTHTTPAIRISNRLMSRYKQTRAIALPQPRKWYHKLNARCSNLVIDDGFADTPRLGKTCTQPKPYPTYETTRILMRSTAPNKSMIPMDRLINFPHLRKILPNSWKMYRPLQSPDSLSRRNSELIN
jgi:hypothetical protein